MVFWNLPGWGLRSVGMGTSLGSSSAQSTLYLDYGHHQSHFPFCWVQFLVCQSCFYFVEFDFGLVSLFIVHVESLIIVVFYRFTYDVLIGSFSDVIFYLEYVAFSHEYALHILRWCAFMLSIWYIFTYIMITLAWPIMEDIEPIDLGSGDRPREFETVTHFTFWLEQCHMHTHIPTLWTCWPTHFESDMTPPLGTITRLYHSYSPSYIIVPLPILSIIPLNLVVFEMVWPEVSSTRW